MLEYTLTLLNLSDIRYGVAAFGVGAPLLLIPLLIVPFQQLARSTLLIQVISSSCFKFICSLTGTYLRGDEVN